jgi:hypothetical protein
MHPWSSLHHDLVNSDISENAHKCGDGSGEAKDAKILRHKNFGEDELSYES